ncbi:acyl-CoA dehydrogenase [Peribacillus cavernae]|uniref:Acyl-CoA dehydrogenase n=1 Tax=Peribacillus cavernae TaxID=1674310 RepID=A0A3S0VRA8_9BACI|nr:acyl-CoA dehydrogenase family protein [Peribacillus cavernae]MDQ0220675.1 alkylation response protein AidB-like acyl-CoA dehydrogenase [Peribacillus cavernae]RUQ31128.1 acyl-CoA dehydrogenase [Peribacillus cavernae]
MPFYQSEEQKEYIENLGKAIERFSKREQELDESGGFPFTNINELKQFGYNTLTLAKKYGGKGGSLYDYLLSQERIARESGPTALAIGWHAGVVLELVENQNWDEEVLDEFFREIANGALVNRAATEPQTGSPTRGGRPETTAVKKGNKWLINGRKTFTTLAPVLDLFIVSAWIPEEETIGSFLIHKDTKGLRIEETWDVISMQGTGSHDLVLENVEIPEKYYVEKQEDRPRGKSAWLLHIPACYLGIAMAARDYAVEFAKTYSPNSLNGPISELPNVQRVIGEIELEMTEARHFLYSVAEKWQTKPDYHDELSRDLAAVKFRVTNNAISIVDKAMRVVGAKSLQRTNPLQRYYRDVRAGLHNPPMDDSTIQLLAKSALYEDRD